MSAKIAIKEKKILLYINIMCLNNFILKIKCGSRKIKHSIAHVINDRIYQFC